MPHDSPLSRRRRAAACVALFVGVLAVYLVSPVILSFDSRLVLYESTEIVEHRSLDLSRYGPIVQSYALYRHDGHEFSRYPYGTAVLAAPVVAAVDIGGRIVGYDWPGHIREHKPRHLEKAIASLIVALAVVAMTVLAFHLTQRVAPALITGLLFAFGTSAWSTASRALWQHGPLLLMMTLGLLCLVKARTQPRWAAVAGLPLGFAYVIRPTAVIPLVFAALLVLVVHRRQLPLFVVGALVTVLPSIVYNLVTFDSPLIPYYGTSSPLFSGSLTPTFWNALAANLVSPARGLLVFSPLVAFAVVGLWISRRELDGVHALAVATVVAHLVVVSNIVIWWGGHSYGPRFLIDVLPFLFFLMVPVVDRITRPPVTVPVAALAAVFALSAAWSVFVHARGAFDFATERWNARPAEIDTHTDRIWDWGDPQFLRTSGEGR